MARLHLAGWLRSRLVLSAALSAALLLLARRERGDASLSTLLVVPAFALLHHAAAGVVHLRGTRAALSTDVRLAELSALRALAWAYSGAAACVVLVLLVYWRLLAEVACAPRTLLDWACYDPRDMRWVLAQALLAPPEAALAWGLYRDARAAAPPEPPAGAYALLAMGRGSDDALLELASGSGSEPGSAPGSPSELVFDAGADTDDDDDGPPRASSSRLGTGV